MTWWRMNNELLETDPAALEFSTGLTPPLVLKVQPLSARKYKCTQAEAESPPQRPASSETGYNLENNIAQALRARMATLTARTGNWNIREEGGVQSPKRVRDSDW